MAQHPRFPLLIQDDSGTPIPDQTCSGAWHVIGRRVTVCALYAAHQRGETADDLAARFDLSSEAIMQAIQFATDQPNELHGAP